MIADAHRDSGDHGNLAGWIEDLHLWTFLLMRASFTLGESVRSVPPCLGAWHISELATVARLVAMWGIREARAFVGIYIRLSDDMMYR